MDEFFENRIESRRLYDALMVSILSLGTPEIKISKSQIAFRRKKPFAWVWIPGRYLRGKTAPLVLTLTFPNRNSSPRWKEIVEPASGRFIHHLEIFSTTDIDEEVNEWLRSAWELAG